MKRILAATGLALLALAAARAEDASPSKLPEIRETGRHYLWEIKKGNHKAYLLGSIHALPKGFYPLPKPVLNAYKASQAIALEAYSNDQAEAQRIQTAMLQKGRYPDGESLKDHLPADLFRKFQAFCKKKKLPAAELEKLKPFLVAYAVETRDEEALGVEEQNGIESFFGSRALRDRKQILSLEDLAKHFNAPFGGDDTEDAAMIEQLVQETTAYSEKDILDFGLKAWKAGDAATLYDFAVTEQLRRYPGLAPYCRRMVFDRNVIMADAIEGFLKGGQTVFSIAGMMHCGGEEGVPTLLKKRGYQVTQVLKPAEPKPEAKP